MPGACRSNGLGGAIPARTRRFPLLQRNLAASRVTTAAGRPASVASRSGFETAIPVNSSAKRFEVQALNGAGKVLGTSKAFASG